MTRLKAISATLILLLSSLAVAGLALEAWLAIIQINTKAYDRYIPGKGTTYVPGAYYRHTKEGFSEGYINSHGFRDYERSYEKPPGTFRIAVFGDSYTEGLQVAVGETFSALLEKKLNNSSGAPRVEVLNMGQSGFGTADAYMRYVNFGVHFSPDLVILAFLTGNDIQDNSRFLNRDNVAFYFTLTERGELVLDRALFAAYESSLTLLKRLFHALKRRSYLASLISERVYLLRLQLREEALQANQEDGGASGSTIGQFSPLNIYVEDVSDPWKDAFAVTKALLRRFKETVEANGSKFLLVTLSNAEQVHSELQQELREEHGGALDFDRPDRMIGEFAREAGISHLQLMPAFREHHRRTGEYLHGFGGSKGGHWNEKGHRLAADQIFETLCHGLLSGAATSDHPC
jgi:hypothetical protein